MSKKVMVSDLISWHGVTKPSFVNNNDIKINKENYCWHLRNELFSATGKVVKRDDLIFAQDEAPSHRSHLVKNFHKTKLKPSFIRVEEWPPSSPDVNPLDHFYWDFVKPKFTKEDPENRLQQKLN